MLIYDHLLKENELTVFLNIFASLLRYKIPAILLRLTVNRIGTPESGNSYHLFAYSSINIIVNNKNKPTLDLLRF